MTTAAELERTDPDLAALIAAEERRQLEKIRLIPSIGGTVRAQSEVSKILGPPRNARPA